MLDMNAYKKLISKVKFPGGNDHLKKHCANVKKTHKERRNNYKIWKDRKLKAVQRNPQTV